MAMGWVERPVSAALGGFVNDAVDASAADVFIEAVIFDDGAEVRPLADPVAFLDDPAVHVDDVEATVWAGGGIDWAEIGIP